jgi:hypothetical protein
MEFLKSVVEKLGFDNETLSKIENNEVTIDEAVTGYVSKLERTVQERIAKQVEESKSAELFGAAYAKTEKQIADAFGIELKKYESVDKKDRFKTIVSDLKNSQVEMIEKLKQEYTSADAQKLQQLTQQLELANAKLSEKEMIMQQAIKEEQSKFQSYIKNQQIEKVRGSLVESVKNARLTPKEMRAIFEAEVRERGLDFEIDADGYIWVNKDGNRVKHPTKPTENLKYETLFEIVAAEYSFEKQSNGNTTKSFEIDEKTKTGIHPARLKYMQDNGLI